MQKRGQVTIFIIIGIIILLVAGSFFFLKDNFGDTKSINQVETASVTSFIEQCLEKSTTKSLYTTLNNGGYNQYPLDLSLLSFTEKENVFALPYYFQNKQSSLPSLNTVADQTALGAIPIYEECLDNFNFFKEKGYVINAGQPEIKIAFTRSGTRVSLSHPVTIKLGETESGYNQFISLIPFDFVSKYEFVQGYLETQEESPETFQISPLSSAAYENNFIYGFNQYGDEGKDVVLNFVYDEGLEEEPILYRFGLGFDWVTETIEIPPTDFEPEPSVSIILPDEWNIDMPGIYNLEARSENDKVSFSTDPSTLPINPVTGIITLDTKNFPNDEYLYYVIATDNFDNENIAPFVINVNVNPGNLPIIQNIPQQTAEVGKEYVFKIPISNDRGGITYTDESYLFDINSETGIINFTPTKDDLGTHSIRVNVKNEFGGTWKRWLLEVR
ncbi:MAG: hypothetical protein Q8Q01_01480 [archaeon]|nr:hypothetical protein [archaeon]